MTDLGPLVDTAPYAGDTSDIVALMVLEYQTSVQNVIVRVNFETRKAIQDEEESNVQLGRKPGFISDPAVEFIEGWSELLTGILLMAEEAPLEGPIVGTSGFAEQFPIADQRTLEGALSGNWISIGDSSAIRLAM